MKKHTSILTTTGVGLLMVAICAGCCVLFLLGDKNAFAADSPKRPFPQHVTYVSGAMRPNHRTQAQQDDDLRAAYDRWQSNYLTKTSEGHYRVKKGPGANAPTVSEGQGYGMVIVALMAGYDTEAQIIFDGLWGFFDAHRSPADSRLMAWRVDPQRPDNRLSALPFPAGMGEERAKRMPPVGGGMQGGLAPLPWYFSWFSDIADFPRGGWICDTTNVQANHWMRPKCAITVLK